MKTKGELEADVRRLADDVIRLYTTRDHALLRELYTSDDDVSPVIIDIGPNFTDGAPWVTSKAKWVATIDHYLDLMEGENDTPRVRSMRYEDPKILVDQSLAAFVALLFIELETDGEPKEILTRYTLVLRRTDGPWKIWNEHFSRPVDQEIIVGSAAVAG